MQTLNADFLKKLIQLQQKAKANKSNFNVFGKYSYRSCEDIIQSIKPLLNELELFLILTDDVVCLNENYKSVNGNNELHYENRVYVKATAIIYGESGAISNFAFAREPMEQKGMSTSQVTGTASSYARKYALQGLLGLDDSIDADSNFEQPTPRTNKQSQNNNTVSEKQEKFILKLLGEKTQGQSKEDKIKYFEEVTGLKNFNDLKSMTGSDASKLIGELMESN